MAAGTGAVLAACGAGGGPSAMQQNKTTREVTIRWSTWGDDTNPFNQVAAPRGVKLFNERFPKITVKVEPQPSDWSVKNQTEWLAGAGPDISGHCCDWGPVWARQGLLFNMEPGMKKDVPAKIREDFVEWLMKLFNSPENGQFALPMYTGTIGLYYNKQSFQKAGVAFPDATWDWQKYREAATKLTNSGQGVYGRRLIASYDRNMQRIHSNGGNWVDPKDDTKPAFDQPKALEALRYEWDAAHKEKIAAREGGGAGSAVFPSLAGKTIYQAFSEGLFAMMEEGSWILARMTQENNIPNNVEWDVAPIPRGPAGRITLATNDGWSIWKGSKSTDEAWEFVKFLMSDEWNEIAARDGGQQSGRKSFQDKWEKLFKENYPKLQNKNLTPFKEAIIKNEARPIELFRKHADFARDILPKLITDSIRDGKTSIDAAVKETADLTRALHGR
ncbi:MAG TPA: extracellular solute-binding protein [Chloroflexota bacterium]|nr:extracellular solute-binding protein [Chloroflexota bacterium]